MTLQAERTLQQDVAWRLKMLPVIDIPVPNGLWIPTRTEEERIIVARIIARMKADGMLLSGAVDRVVVWRGGGGLLELKRPKSTDLLGHTRPAGRPSAAQAELAKRAAQLGVNHAFATSWDEVHWRLAEWGAPV